MCWSEPSVFMMKIWSHFTGSRVDWKMSFLPSAEKQASAFCPPKVSWWMLRRCFSGWVAAAGVGCAAGVEEADCWAEAARWTRAQTTNAEKENRIRFMDFAASVTGALLYAP